MHILQVGKLYDPARTQWPEGPHASLTGAGCSLVVFLDSPDEEEIRQIRAGAAEFAWADCGEVAILCFRFGVLPWMDAPNVPWTEPESRRGAPVGDAGNGLALQVILVDAATGIVKGLRLLSWEPGFAEAVRQTIRRQLASPRNDRAAALRLDALYRLDSSALAEHAAVRCLGGADASRVGQAKAEAAIGRHVAGVVSGKSYPSQLPGELAPWYVYTADGGHSVLVALAAFYAPGADPAEFLVPAPVRAVIRAGWTAQDGWLVCDLRYHPGTGLITDPGDDEY